MLQQLQLCASKLAGSPCPHVHMSTFDEALMIMLLHDHQGLVGTSLTTQIGTSGASSCCPRPPLASP